MGADTIRIVYCERPTLESADSLIDSYGRAVLKVLH